MSGILWAKALHILVIYDCVHLVKLCIIKRKDTKKFVVKVLTLALVSSMFSLKENYYIFLICLKTDVLYLLILKQRNVRQADERLMLFL